MTKHAPATPLRIVGEVQMKKIQHDMTVLRRTNERLMSDLVKLVEDRSKLVEALHWSLAIATHDQRNSDWGDKVTELLRSLGEDA